MIYVQNENKIDEKIYQYLIIFLFHINLLKYKINKNLLYQLKLCIAISYADIASGTNRRLKIKYDHLVIDEKYISYDPWTKYKLNQNYIHLRKNIIDIFNNMIDNIMFYY